MMKSDTTLGKIYFSDPLGDGELFEQRERGMYVENIITKTKYDKIQENIQIQILSQKNKSLLFTLNYITATGQRLSPQ